MDKERQSRTTSISQQMENLKMNKSRREEA